MFSSLAAMLNTSIDAQASNGFAIPQSDAGGISAAPAAPVTPFNAYLARTMPQAVQKVSGPIVASALDGLEVEPIVEVSVQADIARQLTARAREVHTPPQSQFTTPNSGQVDPIASISEEIVEEAVFTLPSIKAIVNEVLFGNSASDAKDNNKIYLEINVPTTEIMSDNKKTYTLSAKLVSDDASMDSNSMPVGTIVLDSDEFKNLIGLNTDKSSILQSTQFSNLLQTAELGEMNSTLATALPMSAGKIFTPDSNDEGLFKLSAEAFKNLINQWSSSKSDQTDLAKVANSRLDKIRQIEEDEGSVEGLDAFMNDLPAGVSDIQDNNSNINMISLITAIVNSPESDQKIVLANIQTSNQISTEISISAEDAKKALIQYLQNMNDEAAIKVEKNLVGNESALMTIPLNLLVSLEGGGEMLDAAKVVSLSEQTQGAPISEQSPILESSSDLRKLVEFVEKFVQKLDVNPLIQSVENGTEVNAQPIVSEGQNKATETTKNSADLDQNIVAQTDEKPVQSLTELRPNRIAPKVEMQLNVEFGSSVKSSPLKIDSQTMTQVVSAIESGNTENEVLTILKNALSEEVMRDLQTVKISLPQNDPKTQTISDGSKMFANAEMQKIAENLQKTESKPGETVSTSYNVRFEVMGSDENSVKISLESASGGKATEALAAEFNAESLNQLASNAPNAGQIFDQQRSDKKPAVNVPLSGKPIVELVQHQTVAKDHAVVMNVDKYELKAALAKPGETVTVKVTVPEGQSVDSEVTLLRKTAESLLKMGESNQSEIKLDSMKSGTKSEATVTISKNVSSIGEMISKSDKPVVVRIPVESSAVGVDKSVVKMPVMGQNETDKGQNSALAVEQPIEIDRAHEIREKSEIPQQMTLTLVKGKEVSNKEATEAKAVFVVNREVDPKVSNERAEAAEADEIFRMKETIESDKSFDGSGSFDRDKDLSGFIAKDQTELVTAGSKESFKTVADKVHMNDNVVSREEIRNVEMRAHSPKTVWNSEEVTGKIVRQAVLSRNKGVVEMQMTLQPEHLGKLSMKIKIEDQHMVAHVQVESSEAKALIQDNLQNLRESLADQGVEIDKFDVDVRQESYDQLKQNAMNNFAQNNRRSNNNSGSTNHSIFSQTEEPAEVAAAVRTFGYNTIELVA